MKFKMMILTVALFSTVHAFANQLCYKNSNQSLQSVSLRQDDTLENQYAVTVRNGHAEYTAWYKVSNISNRQLELTKTADLSSDASVLPDRLTLSVMIGILTNYHVLEGSGFFLNNSVTFGDSDCGPEVPYSRPPWQGGAHGGCPNSPRNHCI